MLSCALHRTSRPFVYLASLLIFAHILTAAAEKRQFVLEVTWKIAAPDCVQRRIVAINGTLPGPVLNVTTGDSLEVQVINRMPSEAVTIHWHGIRMTGSPWDDGAAFINQCPILPGGSYTYNFSVPDQAGTFWYHAHLGNLKSAGAFGLLVVSERARADYPFEFDVDKPFLIGDWIHADEAYNREYLAYTANSVLLNGIGRFNCTPTDGNVLDNLVACAPGQGALGVPSEPVCGETFLSFQAGKRYLLRMINTGDTEYLRVQFQGHNLTVVQADSSYTEPVTVDWLMVAPGQTYGAILQTDQPLGAYWFTVQAVLSATPACRAATNSDECATLTGTLLYEGSPTGQYSGAPPPNSPDLQEKQFQQHLAEVLQFDRRIRQHPRHIRAMPPVTRTITVGVTSSFDGTRPVFNLNRGESVLPATPLLHASYFGVPLETDTTSANTQPAGDAEALITLGPKRTPIYHIGSGDGVLVILQNSQVTPQLAGASTAANGLPTGDPTFNYTGQQAVLLSVSIPHSWHLHGHDFWVLGEGLGLYDPEESPKSFNLVNPIYRNVATHLPGGWRQGWKVKRSRRRQQVAEGRWRRQRQRQRRLVVLTLRKVAFHEAALEKLQKQLAMLGAASEQALIQARQTARQNSTEAAAERQLWKKNWASRATDVEEELGKMRKQVAALEEALASAQLAML